jgi:hypothetical protein
MTCEFCDGLGAVLITDINEKKITDKDVFKEKIISYEYGEDDFIALTVSTPVGKALIIDNDTDELVILCDWCDGYGK